MFANGYDILGSLGGECFQGDPLHGQAWSPAPAAARIRPLPDAAQCFLRHGPELFLASGLFLAAHVRRHKVVEGAEVETLSAGKSLHFCGELLDQGDLDVLLACLAACLEQGAGAGQLWRVPPAMVLERLGRRPDRPGHEALLASLKRLETARIEVQGDRYRSSIRLVTRLLVDTADRAALLELDAGLLAAFRGRAGLTAMLHQRKDLGRDGLAKWLHAMAWALSGCFAIDLGLLRRLCGREGTTLGDFTRELCAALRALMDAGALALWEVRGRSVVFDHGRIPDDGSCPLFT